MVLEICGDVIVTNVSVLAAQVCAVFFFVAFAHAILLCILFRTAVEARHTLWFVFLHCTCSKCGVSHYCCFSFFFS